LLSAKHFQDKRGWFMELHRARGAGASNRSPALPAFCQDNVSLTALPAVVRGLHFQRPPYAQAKLVTVLCGAILDVIVDLRRGSRDYGHGTMVLLSASSASQLFVPVGFAHGFCSLQAETLVHYKVSAPYVPEAEDGIAWNDPDLGVAWPFTAAEILVSEKDALLPRFRDLAPIDWATRQRPVPPKSIGRLRNGAVTETLHG
jgi:dTDP-4-dehydrorhamnose 3,5-epimerase